MRMHCLYKQDLHLKMISQSLEYVNDSLIILRIHLHLLGIPMNIVFSQNSDNISVYTPVPVAQLNFHS